MLCTQPVCARLKNNNNNKTLTCSGIGGGGGRSLSIFNCVICILMLFKLLIWLFSCAITSAFGSCGPFGPSCGDPARDVLWLRARSLAATAPPFNGCCGGGGDIIPSGTGGGGGRASRPVDILRPRVGVFAFDAFGVAPPLPELGGAGGGCDGLGFVRDGVPGE